MTVTELRMFLEKKEKEGKGDRLISVVSWQNCEPISPNVDKWTEVDVHAEETIYGTIMITD